MSVFDIEIHPDQIRTAGSAIYNAGQSYTADAGLLRGEVEGGHGLGSDRIGTQVRSFHTRVVPDTLTYLKEVGQATEDFGIALGEVAQGYDELLHGNLLAIGTIAESLIDLGLC